ncbi:hypothetical protein LTR08_001312 [Meristemomyces frigidus]|nr:hypothetical protein LTR08_001312 [Meristemomyces frigidus]
MSASKSAINFLSIRKHIRVHHYDANLHNRRDAARFIQMGYRVTDDYGRDLTVETCADGSRHVVIGTDLLGSRHDDIATVAIARAAHTDETGRPSGLPERELTDYEAGRCHVAEDCTFGPDCDHPVHFGGDEYGKLVFEEITPATKRDDAKDKKNNGKDGGSDSGATGGGSGGAKIQ